MDPKKTERVVKCGRFGKFYKNRDTKLWWSKDLAGHGGSAWKVFEERGNTLVWIADADEYGRYLKGKHKSDTGAVINLKTCSAATFD